MNVCISMDSLQKFYISFIIFVLQFFKKLDGVKKLVWLEQMRMARIVHLAIC